MNWGPSAQQEPGSWIDLLLGPLGLLIGALLTVWAFATGKVISRREFDAMVEDRDHWRSLALGDRSIAREAVHVVKETV